MFDRRAIEATVSRSKRAMSTLAYLIGFGLVAMVMHVLRALGGEGYITFTMREGFTHFTVTPDYVWAVYLSGGLLTGVGSLPTSLTPLRNAAILSQCCRTGRRLAAR